MSVTAASRCAVCRRRHRRECGLTQLAAGQGASAPEDYLNNCLQGPKGYPALLGAENKIHLRTNAACTGATTSDVSDEQLSALKESTRLVTLTVGAADLGLSRVLVACTAGTPTQCQGAIRSANLLLPAECGDESELGRRLTDLYADVAAPAPNALIVATGYPLLFELVQGDPDRSSRPKSTTPQAA